MKKSICKILTFLMMFSLMMTQAFALEDEVYDALNADTQAEMMQLLDDDTEFPAGYDVLISSMVYYDVEHQAIVLDQLFTHSEDDTSLTSSTDLDSYVENTYYDVSKGCVVTERVYQTETVPNNSALTEESATSSGRWYMNKKQNKWVSGDITNYYAEGYFQWDGSTVTVSNADGDYDFFPPKMTFLGEKVSVDYGEHGGKEFAQSTYRINFVNGLGKNDILYTAVRVYTDGTVDRL